MGMAALTFSKPKQLVQIFINEYIYGKEERAYDQRAAQLAWQEMRSRSGYVDQGELFLPEAITGDRAFASSELITLQDFQDHGLSRGILNRDQPNQCLRVAPGPVSILDDLGISFGEELRLHFMDKMWSMAIPRRNPMTLCHLVKDKPVEIKYNYKWDFSMASRRQRQYVDYVFVAIYLGQFSHGRLLPVGSPVRLKRVPAAEKLVNLWKPLW
jgi:hypothetical protein